MTYRFINAVVSLLWASLSVSALSAQPLEDDSRRIDQAAQQAQPEWPSFGMDYSNQRFFPSQQIHVNNVSQLRPQWQYHTGVQNSFQTTPIVRDGVMYVSLPYNHVLALDAKTGRLLWRYQHQRRADWTLCCGPANRGVAVAHGKVFIGTVDARLIALDASTGKIVWDIPVTEDSGLTEEQATLHANDPNRHARTSGGTGVGIAMAPVVYQDKVIIGITGVGYGLHIDNPTPDAPLGAVIGVAGRYGRPGFLAAFDVNTGRKQWQFDTIPAQGWEGSYRQQLDNGMDLHRDIAQEKANANRFNDAARYGGGSAWSTPAIDTQRGLLYFGTGNPSPQMNDVTRPGDNLYTVSLIALEIATGKLRWHYQQVPHDRWGYDLASPPVLFDLQQGTKRIAAVAQASKTGWLYVHHRETGALLYQSEAFVPQKNLFAQATLAGVTLYPGILGGANWSPAAIDQQQQYAFVAAIHAPIRYTLHEAVNGAEPMRYTSSEPADEPRWGVLSAIDLRNGHLAWQQKTAQPLIGGVLATAGGLIFTGEGNGHFNAYRSSTGELLWQDKLEFGVNAPAISYQIEGKQYIAVAAGGNAIMGYKQGDLLVVYALDEKNAVQK